MNKKDGVLFKFMLNHDFIYDVARQHRCVRRGLEVYENFEIEFQMDGHFWLQYGLYMLKLDRHDDALRLLRHSIGAYPENTFAQHALAHLQLRLAFFRTSIDREGEELIAEAVSALESLAARETLAAGGPVIPDTYPLVTLAQDHVAVLAKHGSIKEARKYAADYHERLQTMERTFPQPAIKRSFLLSFYVSH